MHTNARHMHDASWSFISPQAKLAIKKSMLCVCFNCVYGRPTNWTNRTAHDIRKFTERDRHDHMVSLNPFVIYFWAYRFRFSTWSDFNCCLPFKPKRIYIWLTLPRCLSVFDDFGANFLITFIITTENLNTISLNSIIEAAFSTRNHLAFIDYQSKCITKKNEPSTSGHIWKTPEPFRIIV